MIVDGDAGRLKDVERNRMISEAFSDGFLFVRRGCINLPPMGQ